MKEKDVKIGFGADYSDDGPIGVVVSRDLYEAMAYTKFNREISRREWEYLFYLYKRVVPDSVWTECYLDE